MAALSPEYLLNGLMQRGLPRHVAEGFVMNARSESGLNPGINEAAPIVPGSRGGFGLLQWTGPRRRELESFAAAKGAEVSNPDLQMDFLMQELGGSEKGAMQRISSATTAGQAGAAIVNSFLRPAEQHRAAREREYMGLLGNSYQPDMAQMKPVGGNQMQGILGMVAPETQQQPATFGERLRAGAKDGSLWDALAMGFNTMRGSDADQGLSSMLQNRMASREDGQRRNQTAEWLRQNGHEDLAAAIDQGVMDGGSAMGMIMQKQQQSQEQNQTIAWLDSIGRGDLSDAVRAGALPIGEAFNQAAARPDPWAGVKEVNGQLVEMGQGGPAVIGDYRTPESAAGTADMQNYNFYGNQEIQAGREPLPFNEWKLQNARAGATTVSVGSGEGGRNAEFDKVLGKGRADQYLAIQTSGRDALRRSEQLGQLETALAGSPSGFEAMAKQKLGDWGVSTDGLDKLQAANALIEQMVPAQRAPGSGTMSDADITMYRNSLPRLINTPEGNRLIIEQARKIQTYDAQMGAIADQVVSGAISPDEGDKLMREIGNPMEGFADKVNAIGGGSAPASVPSVGEVRQGFRFKGGNPADANAWEKVQ